MGCYCCKISRNRLKFFNDFELSLKFHLVDSIHLFESVLKQIGRGCKQIDKKNLITLWSNSQLPFKEHQRFYSNFVTDKSDSIYKSQQLLNLVIIYSALPLKSKGKLLWINYTTNNSEIISIKTVKEIIIDILRIVLEIVPKCVKDLNGKNKRLRSVIQKLAIAKPFIQKKFINEFFVSEDNICEKEFLEIFEVELGKFLVFPKKLREFALEFEEKLENDEQEGKIKAGFNFSGKKEGILEEMILQD